MLILYGSRRMQLQFESANTLQQALLHAPSAFHFVLRYKGSHPRQQPKAAPPAVVGCHGVRWGGDRAGSMGPRMARN